MTTTNEDCLSCNEEAYEEYLNGLDEVDILGVSYSVGTLLREVDRVRFECGMVEHPCTCMEGE